MSLIAKWWRYGMSVVFCLLLPSGCSAMPQQSSSSSVSVTPTNRKISTEQPPPAPRGIQGIIPGPTAIVPGQSVGSLQLGDTRERALQLFGKPTEEYTFDEHSLGACKYTEMHWNDLDHEDRWGVFVYLKDNHIYQIISDTPRYATSDGITSDSSPKEVQDHFPQLQSYVLLYSAGKVNGGRDLIYWVNQAAGIAFEFYYHPKRNKRLVASVIVFEPGVEFLPKGCIWQPQEWRGLKPFTLEVPNNQKGAAQ